MMIENKKTYKIQRLYLLKITFRQSILHSLIYKWIVKQIGNREGVVAARCARLSLCCQHHKNYNSYCTGNPDDRSQNSIAHV